MLLELKETLEHLQAPVLSLVQAKSNAIAANANNKAMLEQLFGGLITLLRIFYDLNVQDLPGVWTCG